MCNQEGIEITVKQINVERKFMRITSVILTVLVLCSALPAATPDWFEGSFEEAQATAAADGKLLLVDFVSTT